MRAARLINPGEPLKIEDVPEPAIRPGGVKISVTAAAVPTFTGAVMGGKMPMPLPVPYTPGPSCVGRVEEVASDVIGFKEGDFVFCSPTYSEGAHGRAPERILIGWFGLTPGSGMILERWRDGAFAEKAVYPAACVTPLGREVDPDLAKLGQLAIAYGGLLRAELQPGQSVLINGATGNLGSSAVLMALAMGASRVVAVGRNAEVLDSLRSLDRRVVATPVDAVDAVDPVDTLVDLLGYVSDPEPVTRSLARLRPEGTAVLMGGVMADIPISYLQVLTSQWTLRGAFMHPPSAIATLVRMVQAGSLDLSRIRAIGFPLAETNEAIRQAATMRGLKTCLVRP